ncbi:DUF3099 domain-containing protein [Microbacterium laevaniformans]|uniref:DUF3099 domain-containing protein n=1 Tax=Microbacterium laevaniformans TaxID=36807 RepID=A0A4S2D9U5_9MICO|nr:DUF3099 domain-containing protein [Microbacterium laevaniformans]TGY37611.1 DUF3099 domain-containing protein [Microbacterium laevaniformans]
MKSSRAQSATSLPRAPRDDASARMTKYFTMMVIRVICFVLMVAVTPYSWYTWLFGAGAMLLPYFAVVIANVASGSAERAIAPERAIEASPTLRPPSDAPNAAVDETPRVIRLSESSRQPPAPRTPSDDE